MRLKTFIADSLPEAMEQVRERLGDEAIILSTEDDPEGNGVRITAALNEELEEPGIFDGDDGLDAFNRLSEALEYHRVPVGLSDRLMTAAGNMDGDTPTMALASALDLELQFMPLPQGPTERPLLLLGPPGAGKTATAAKLAAQVRVRGKKATMITLDTGKAGGLAQVTAFTEALGAELREARDAESLKRAVSACPDNHFVVIDAIGASPFDGDAMREIADWLELSGAEGVLVIQGGGDPLESAEFAIAYAKAGARRLIATKLDATRRLGGVLSAAHAADLTLMGLGTAPTIGGGLRPVNPVQLSKLILPEEAGDEPELTSPAVANGAGT
jgi:flagellar biosynthesis protein FlhF